MASKWIHIVAACVSLNAAIGSASAAERATITGKVLDAPGKSIEHATVFVYEGRVKKGYGAYCPTCWMDCGKHATTDVAGNYTITGLDPDLQFTLLAVHEGYSPATVNKVDPAKGLKLRPTIGDASQVVRGRVVNAHGNPMAGAVVEQQGVSIRESNGQMAHHFGPGGWIDRTVVTMNTRSSKSLTPSVRSA